MYSVLGQLCQMNAIIASGSWDATVILAMAGRSSEVASEIVMERPDGAGIASGTSMTPFRGERLVETVNW